MALFWYRYTLKSRTSWVGQAGFKTMSEALTVALGNAIAKTKDGKETLESIEISTKQYN